MTLVGTLANLQLKCPICDKTANKYSIMIIRRECGGIKPRPGVLPDSIVIVGKEAIEQNAVPPFEDMDDLKEEIDNVQEELVKPPIETREKKKSPTSAVDRSSIPSGPGPDVKRTAGVLDVFDIDDEDMLSVAGLVHNFECNMLGRCSRGTSYHGCCWC